MLRWGRLSWYSSIRHQARERGSLDLPQTRKLRRPGIEFVQSPYYPRPPFGLIVVVPKYDSLARAQQLESDARVIQDIFIGVRSIDKHKIHLANIGGKIEFCRVTIMLGDLARLGAAQKP